MMAPGDGHPRDQSSDKRRATRRRVLFSGKLVNDDASMTIDCVIRDLSQTGAKVRLAGTAPVPNEVWLIEVREGLAFRCRVAWRASPELGLEFSASHDLKDPTSPELRMLKRIWVENAAR